MSKENSSNSVKIDYLTEDPPITGQNYVCISFVSPEGIRNTTVRGLKIRGIFDKYEDAQKHAEELRKTDSAFHIFVGEVGKWLPWDPHPDDKTKVKDSEYYEKELQALVKEYEKNMERAKKAESERKREMLQKSIQTAKKNQNSKDKFEAKKEELRKKVQDNKKENSNNKENSNKQQKLVDTNETIQLENTEQLKEKEKLMELEQKRISENEKKIKEKEENLRAIDENLSKLKGLYEKLQNNKKD